MPNRWGPKRWSRHEWRAMGAAIVIALASGRGGVSAVSAKGTTRQVAVQAGGDWVDTGIDVGAGAKVNVTAEGSIQFSDATQAADPEGLPRGWKDLLRVMPLNSAGRAP